MLVTAGCKQQEPLTGKELASLLAEKIDIILFDYHDANVAISIIDHSRNVVIHGDGNRLFHAASTMKVPVMIELYRQEAAGYLSLDDSLLVENQFRSIVDGSVYSIEDDSDDTIYDKLGSFMTMRELAYNMITVSSNLATNLLIDRLSADSVQATSERLGTLNAKTVRGVEDLKAFDQGLSNSMTSRDLAILMEAIRTGIAVSPASDQEMVELLLSQFFNSMISAGVPREAKVAHKTGSITSVHHDAAIIYPPEDDSFVLVVMTDGIEDRIISSELGARIAAAAYKVLRGPNPPDGN